MLKTNRAFSSFSVDDMKKAKDFYGKTLGLKVEEVPEGLNLHTAGNLPILIYQSNPKTYKPPTHTILNFLVKDIDDAVAELEKRGVHMEQYDMPMIKTDKKGIARTPAGQPGPKAIAWF